MARRGLRPPRPRTAPMSASWQTARAGSSVRCRSRARRGALGRTSSPTRRLTRARSTETRLTLPSGRWTSGRWRRAFHRRARRGMPQTVMPAPRSPRGWTCRHSRTTSPSVWRKAPLAPRRLTRHQVGVEVRLRLRLRLRVRLRLRLARYRLSLCVVLAQATGSGRLNLGQVLPFRRRVLPEVRVFPRWERRPRQGPSQHPCQRSCRMWRRGPTREAPLSFRLAQARRARGWPARPLRSHHRRQRHPPYRG